MAFVLLMASPTLHQGPQGGIYYLDHGRKRYLTKSEKKSVTPSPKPRKQDVIYTGSKGRGVRTSGWRETLYPKRPQQRQQIYAECGAQCFLKPKEKKYVICGKCKKSGCTCKKSCAGIKWAEIHAKHWKEYEVAEKAQVLYRKYGCGK